jgi:hypothetical protein
MAVTEIDTPLTQPQALAQAFFTGMNRADRAGMPLASQRRFHVMWAATITSRAKAGICRALHQILREMGDG